MLEDLKDVLVCSGCMSCLLSSGVGAVLGWLVTLVLCIDFWIYLVV